jgi:hypothetical protein
LTLFGGFASTVCWPLSAFLVSQIGWRGACLVYAVIQLAVALPLYLFVLPSGPSRATPRSGPFHSDPTPPGVKASPLLVVLLAVTITLAAMISSLVSVHLLTILQASGIALAAAVGLGALVGPSQVAARTVEMFIARFHHPIWTKIVSASFVAVGISTLWAGMPFVPASLAFYGSGIGLESIARGTLPLALFGASGYATLMGRLAMPSLLAQATAPWLGAVLMERVGAQGTLAALSCAAGLNVAFVLGLAWIVGRRIASA